VTGLPCLGLCMHTLHQAMPAHIGVTVRNSTTAIPSATGNSISTTGSEEVMLPNASSVEWHHDPDWHNPHLNPMHQPSRVVLLRNVIVQGLRVLLFGVPAALHEPLRRLPKYKVFPPDPPNPIKFSFEFVDARPAVEKCRRSFPGPVFLLPPHHPANAFHVHNDLMLKVAWLLMSNGGSPRPKETTLLLLRGNDREVLNPANLFDLLTLVLKEVVHPAEDTLLNGACFSQLVWSPLLCWPMHAEPLYKTILRGWHWPRAINYWADLAISTLGVAQQFTPEEATSRQLHLLWVKRSSNRHVANLDQVVVPTLQRRFHVELLGAKGWPRGRDGVAHTLRAMQQADVFAGIHGAGLAHGLYVRPGTLMLELRVNVLFDMSLFLNVAMLRKMPYYTADVRRFASSTPSSITVSLPEAFVEKLGNDLHANSLRHRAEVQSAHVYGAEPGWQFNGPECTYGDMFLYRELPRDGTLSSYAHSRCYLHRYIGRSEAKPGPGEWSVGDQNANPQPQPIAAGLWREALKAVGPGGEWLSAGPEPGDICKNGRADFQRNTAFDQISPGVILERVHWKANSGWDWMGNAIPFYFLVRAIAVMAQVPHVRILNYEAARHPDFLIAMLRRVYIPPMPSPPDAAYRELQKATQKVCKCTSHTCADASVWEAFQGFWREELRSGLLEYTDIHSEGVHPAILNATVHSADLAVHLRCGDILKYRHHSEYGYLPLSAYRTALAGRTEGALLRIRIVTSPLSGPGAREKDLRFAEMCRGLADGLRELLEDAFRPADVIVDRVADLATSWARLVFAKRTLCNPSTYCLWPTMAANNGFLGDSPLFFSQSHPRLEGVTYLTDVPFLNMPQIIDRGYGSKEIVEWIRAH